MNSGPLSPRKYIGACRWENKSAKTQITSFAFMEMWVHVAGGQYFSKGINDVVSQKTDWRTIQTPFLFQQGQRPDKVTLNIVINGKGTMCIDDIVLSKEPLN